MLEKILQRKLPLSMIVTNGGLIIGIIIGSVNFYNQFEQNTRSIENLGHSIGSLEERIDRSNVESLNDMYFQLNDQIQGAATDIGWQIDELKREATDRSDRSREEAGYLAERLVALEARSDQLEATSWRAEETQKDIAAVREQLAVLQASTTEFDVERVESDLSYLKERVIWLEAQAGQPLDTQWLEEQINELRNQVVALEGVIADDRLAQVSDLFMVVDDLLNRLTMLENVGNHARLLEKARGE